MFEKCKSLNVVEIGKNVTSIGDYAFYSCDMLKSIIIPDSVTSIGDYVFYNCDSLKSITIEVGLKSIGAYAFFECNSFYSIYYSGTKQQFFDIEKGEDYKSCSAGTTLYCSDGEHFLY